MNIFRVNEYICELLYQGAKHSVFAHFLGISTVLYIFRDIISYQIFLYIIFIFSIAILGRAISIYLYFKQKQSKKSMKFWYIVYFFGLLASSLVWATTLALLFPDQHPSYQLLIIIIVMGFVTGAIVTMSADKLMVLVFTQPVILMIIILLFLSDDIIYHSASYFLIFLNIPIITSALTSSEESFRLYESALIERKMNAAKTDFLAKMSHELRTPMNAVIGITYLLKQTNLSTAQQDYLVKLQYASHSLLDIINDILDFSRIEAGQMVLETVPFRLDKVLTTVSTHVEVQAKKKALDFSIEIDKNIEPWLLGDAFRLTQILTNLSANAVKFTQQGSIRIHLCQLANDNNRVQIQFKVMDTGIGIKKSDKHKLFNSFTQVHTSDARKYGGSGLGLSICQNLLMLMDSKIEINSMVGVGTSFSFVIWFDIATKGDRNAEEDKQHEASIRLEIIPELLDKQILLVDDDDLNLMVAAEILQKLGLNVSRAKSATEAFTVLEQTNILPDLILMDLQMPEVTGYQAFDILQKKSQWQKIPVVALTANASTLEKKKALEYGMNAFLTKPINPYLLKQTLLKWITHEDRPPIQMGDTINNDNDLFNLLKQHLDSAIEVEEKLKLVIDMLGKESAAKLFKSVDEAIREEKPQLMRQLQAAQKNEASALAHRLKGSLSLYSSTKLMQLLLQIEKKDVDFEDSSSLCSTLRAEFDCIQKSIKAYL